MNSQPTILEATFKDLPAILTLQKECYQENAERYNNDQILPIIQTQQDIEEEFENTLFLKAVDNDKIVASIRGFQDNMTCYIVRLFVHPDAPSPGD